MNKVVAVAAWGLAAVLAGCGSDEGTTGFSVGSDCPEADARTCGVLADGHPAVLVCLSGTWAVAETCAVECALALNKGPYCKGQPPADVETDFAADAGDVVDQGDGGEVGDAPDVPDGEEATPDQEVVFPDLKPDLTPPAVVSTSPVDGEMGVAMPFSVKVLFSEPMFQTTVNDKTVKLFDAKGTELGISIAFEDEAGTKLAVTPTGAVFPASPYRLKLNPMMSDLAGNPLGVTLDISFYTGVVGLGPYKALAGKYAPLIYQATSEEHPEFDFLTRFDLDGDWVAKDNVDFMKTNLMKVESVVYYSVVETRSHYFITYVFYYPYRPVAGSEFGNDVSGATVVVRKLNEAPVAVETYFKQDNDERSLSFVVEGGGLVPDGQSAYDYAKFDEMYAGQDLFPNGHFVSYLSAGKHESCLWIDENNSTFDGCQLNAGIKDMMKKVEYQYTDGTAGEIAKAGGTFPPTAKTSYGLSHIVESWWARRTDVGEDKMWASAYKYVPFENTLYPDRPDLNDEIPSFFVDPIGNDNGRPPWAWKWNPQNGVTFYEMNRGVFFLDPAMHFKQRHDPAAMWKLWDGTDGWSADYCYNPYFNLDFRGIWPECSPKPE